MVVIVVIVMMVVVGVMRGTGNRAEPTVSGS